MNKLLRLNLIALLLVAVFDPGDLITHLKVPLFILVWVMVLADIGLFGNAWYGIPSAMLNYTLFFSVVLPLSSIALYLVLGGGTSEFDGFQYLKAYLFLTIAIPLGLKRIDLIRSLCRVLTGLSFATILLYLVVVSDETLRGPLWLFGDIYGLFALSERTYGNLSFMTVYFHTSPLLVIAVAYFSYRLLKGEGSRVFGIFLLAINMVALLMSGTRNNIMAAVLTPLMIVMWYKRPNWKYIVALSLLAAIAIMNVDIGPTLFDPDDYSNAMKLTHFRNYMAIFHSSSSTLLLGQGLGSRFYATALGTNVSITELTYLEILRSYGLLGSTILLGLLFYPFRVLRLDAFRESHYMFLAYLFYLFMCASNPFLFSSSGMLILALVVQKTFLPLETSFA